MKKKLLFWEVEIVVTTIAIFIGLFSLGNGWQLAGVKRYIFVVVATVAAGILAIFVAGVIIFVILYIANPTVDVIKDNLRELKSSFSSFSVISLVLIVLGAIVTISFLC